MTKDFVWAIDENGKPCKCFALPENRGKKNCKHKFIKTKGKVLMRSFPVMVFIKVNKQMLNTNNQRRFLKKRLTLMLNALMKFVGNTSQIKITLK